LSMAGPMADIACEIRLNEAANRGGRRGVWRFASCLRGFGRDNPLSDRRLPDGRDQPSAPSHDRGHDGPQSLAGDPAILPACGLEVQPLFWPFPDRLDWRMFAPSRCIWRPRGFPGRRSIRSSARCAFLWRDARLRDDPGADRLCPQTAQAPVRAERRRSGALSRGGLEPQIACRASRPPMPQGCACRK